MTATDALAKRIGAIVSKDRHLLEGVHTVFQRPREAVRDHHHVATLNGAHLP